MSPTLTFIAGANGSGKTTLTRWNPELFKAIPLLDPDAIANTLQTKTSTLFLMAAARHVLEASRKHLDNGESFAIETTLAGKNYLQMTLAARNRGFEIVLIYIGTENVEINLSRIANRVFGGWPRCSSTGRSSAIQTQLYKSSRRNNPSASCYSLRQLCGRWLSVSRSPKRDGKPMVRAETVMDNVLMTPISNSF